MKIWVDDVRPAPEGYTWCKSVNETIRLLRIAIHNDFIVEIIDIDHDAGDYYNDGGDYIRVLDWISSQMMSIPIRIHSMNPVGVQNMRAIIQRNGWTEVR